MSIEHKHMLEDCVLFFKENKAYKRIFLELRKKWKQYGYAAGYIQLDDMTKAECEALSGVLGKAFYEPKVKFKVSEFENALKETKYFDLELIDILSKYFNEDMQTNKNKKIKKLEARNEYFQQLLKKSKTMNGVYCSKWINEVIKTKGFGYYSILMEYEKNPNLAKTNIENVFSALSDIELLNGNEIRLALLSARHTYNPHYFDRQNIGGKLLISALSFLGGYDEQLNSYKLFEMYKEFGILPDDISSFVTAFGINLYTNNGIHKAYEEFINSREFYIISLASLNNIVRADCKNKTVFVFENQMMFSHICSEVRDLEVALLCTSGQMKTAAIKLIDLLCESGCKVYYSGDIDPEGICIADKIILRNRNLIFPWHFSLKDYSKSISNEQLTDARLNKLKNVKLKSLIELSNELIEKKLAGYQEMLLYDMINDIKNID